MSRGDLSESEWQALKELLPSERGRQSRPASDNRLNCEWYSLADPHRRTLAGCAGEVWKIDTVYQRFRRWSAAGVWEVVAATLAQAMADNSHHSIDSTTVQSHVSAAGAKGGLVNKLLAARGAGSPVRFTASVMPPVPRSLSTSQEVKRPTARRSKR